MFILGILLNTIGNFAISYDITILLNQISKHRKKQFRNKKYHEIQSLKDKKIENKFE